MLSAEVTAAANTFMFAEIRFPHVNKLTKVDESNEFLPMLSSLSFGLSFRMAAMAPTSKLAPLSLKLVRLANDCGESFEKQF